MLSSSTIKTELFNILAQKTGKDLTSFKRGKEPLKTTLDLNYHTFYLVSRGHTTKEKYPMAKMKSIDKRFRDREVIFQDLKRRDLRRFETLISDNANQQFIFVIAHKAPDLYTLADIPEHYDDPQATVEDRALEVKKFNEEQVKEAKWITKHIKPKMFSDVKQIPLDEDEIAKKRQLSSWVHVPIRTIRGATDSEQYYKDTEDVSDVHDYLYVLIESMRDIDYLSSRTKDQCTIVANYLGMKPIIISEAKLKYFKNPRHFEYTQELFDEVVSESNVIEQMQEFANDKAIYELSKLRLYKNVKQNFPEWIPSKFKGIAHLSDPEYTHNIFRGVNLGCSNYTPREVKHPDYVSEFGRAIKKTLDKYPLINSVITLDSYNSYIRPSVMAGLKSYMGGIDREIKAKVEAKMTKSAKALVFKPKASGLVKR